MKARLYSVRRTVAMGFTHVAQYVLFTSMMVGLGLALPFLIVAVLINDPAFLPRLPEVVLEMAKALAKEVFE